MTYRAALEILIENAAANVAGVGCGVRPLVTTDKRYRVAEAIAVVRRRLDKREVSDHEWFNLGLPLGLRPPPRKGTER